eukprot:COSAG02_NODE_32675_length_512_cov_1.089588_1_plen_46_part_10
MRRTLQQEKNRNHRLNSRHELGVVCRHYRVRRYRVRVESLRMAHHR